MPPHENLFSLPCLLSAYVQQHYIMLEQHINTIAGLVNWLEKYLDWALNHFCSVLVKRLYAAFIVCSPFFRFPLISSLLFHVVGIFLFSVGSLLAQIYVIEDETFRRTYEPVKKLPNCYRKTGKQIEFLPIKS